MASAQGDAVPVPGLPELLARIRAQARRAGVGGTRALRCLPGSPSPQTR